MEIDEILDRVYPLPAESKELLKAHISQVSYPKGQTILRAGKVEHDLFLVRKGMVRAYADPDGHEVTFWFGKEGDVVISMKNYVDAQPGYEHVETLEACDLYRIKTDDLNKLFENDIHLANWGRVMIGLELIKSEERLIAMQFKTAQQRYLDLITDSPELLQRVQLCHIASYLGITQVSLSRIRSEIR